MTPVSSKSRLAATQWFAAARACGSNLDIRFGHLSQKQKGVTWYHLPHEQFDGIGGLVHLLRQHAADPQRIMPPSTPYQCCGILRPLLKVYQWEKQFIQKQLNTRADWSPGFVNKRDSILDTGQSTNRFLMPESAEHEGMAWVSCSIEQTRRLKHIAKQHGISMNTWLLATLDRAVRPFVQQPQHAIPWMIPVNMRGIECHGNDTANHVSSLTILIPANAQPQLTHLQIRAALARGEHRRNSLLLRWGGILSKAQKERFLENDYKRPHGSIGAFSNLGNWTLPSGSRASLGAPWLFCPPVVRGQLLGAGAVTISGQLGLCIQGHPTLNQAQALGKAWMQRWIEEALKG